MAVTLFKLKGPVLRRTSYKKAILVLAILLLALGLYRLQTSTPIVSFTDTSCIDSGEVDDTFRKVATEYGVFIHRDKGDLAISSRWRSEPANGTAKPISLANLCHYLPILVAELEKYPADVLRENVASIYLLDSLMFFDVAYGGTAMDGSVYLTGGSQLDGYSDDYFRALIHHELSSILIAAYPFPTDQWTSANPSAFRYTELNGDTLQKIARTDNNKSDEALYLSGFLSSYGRTTLENDVNLYAEFALSNPNRLRELSARYPRVAQKTRILEKFYKQIAIDLPEVSLAEQFESR
jgi:hypothetical protein